MHFELLLEAVLGHREIIHELECTICGFYETYYRDPVTRQSIGRVCNTCNFVQKFELSLSEERVS
ncbi:acyltransferase [Cytobacillus firmus]|uniref:acyltransferase n=1 Tax=Cytobacillus firmus TaxID=1399 RepID=UPI001C9882B2|nr:acyltransferase [Cytobacillus firmus]MBY6052109.1 acyltransferase [Cytobacillus firmus]